jgi:hypothetical protein
MMEKPVRPRFQSGGCLTLFGLPFLVVGLGLTLVYFNGYRKWLVTQSWVETPCWIETAELKTTHHEGTTYKAIATYRYVYQGTTYRGDKVSIYGGSDNIGDFQQEAFRELAQYAETPPKGRDHRKREDLQGTPFRCFVNPDDPRQAVIYRVLRWPLQAFMSIFALTFPAVGAGIVFGSLWATRHQQFEEQMMSDFPDHPWTWKKAWSTETIPDGSRPWQSAFDAYSLWAAMILAPLLFATATTGAFARDWYAWLLLIPVGLWLIPASKSWQGIRKRWTMGAARLRIHKPFVEPGSIFAGEIVLEREVLLPEKPHVQLVCEKKVTHESSDGHSVSSETVWRADCECGQETTFMRNFPVSRLPISVAIPVDAKESGKVGDTEYQWKVELDVSRTVIKASFEVPVFHTVASRALAAERQQH